MINVSLALDYVVLKTGNLKGTVAPVAVNIMITFLMLMTLHSTLIVIADRLFIVKFPLKYNNMMTVKKARTAIATMWLVTFLFSILLNVIRMVRDPPSANSSPLEYMGRQHKTNGKYFVFLMTLVIFIEVAVLSGMLYRELQKLLKKRLVSRSNESETLRMKAEREKIATSCRTVLLVMVIYMACFFPGLLNAFSRIINVELSIAEQPYPSEMSEVTQIVLFAVELVGAIVGNLFLLVLLFRSIDLRRSASKNVIFNCASADFTNAMINVSLALDYVVLKTGNLKGTVAPVAVNIMITFLMLMTLHSTLIVIADRLFIVKFPLKYNNMMTVKKARTAIATMWLVTFLFSILLNVIRMVRDPPSANSSPLEYMGRQHKTNGKYFVFLMTLVIFIEVAVLSGMLYRELQKLLKKRLVSRSNESETLRMKAEREKIATSCRTVLLVMVIYMACFFPGLLNAFSRIINVELSIADIKYLLKIVG
ncbi:hypothetical protein QZH41_007247 [Actinostola sp. cb2023]|nr:hypothetical protein QZH41_007247 [Actinostola sp. cb2023]